LKSWVLFFAPPSLWHGGAGGRCGALATWRTGRYFAIIARHAWWQLGEDRVGRFLMFVDSSVGIL
jgi:hypothetical protein